MKIIITILVVLLGLGGGAYYAQDSGLYDFSPLKEYIPSQVKELLNIDDEDTVSVSTNELEEIGIQTEGFPGQSGQENYSYDSQYDKQYDNQIAQNEQNASFLQEQSQPQQVSSAGLNAEENVEKNIENKSVQQPSVASSVMKEPENATDEANRGNLLNEEPLVSQNDIASSNSVIARKEEERAKIEKKIEKKQINVQELDASPEELKMVEELNQIESKIVKLDTENESLQKRYSQMLKENRELALKLIGIDQQIKTLEPQTELRN